MGESRKKVQVNSSRTFKDILVADVVNRLPAFKIQEFYFFMKSS